jgi:hypothetical protein
MEYENRALWVGTRGAEQKGEGVKRGQQSALLISTPVVVWRNQGVRSLVMATEQGGWAQSSESSVHDEPPTPYFVICDLGTLLVSLNLGFLLHKMH